MEKNKVINGLKDFDQFQVKNYANYLEFVECDEKDGVRRNKWMKFRSEEELIDFFKKVNSEGLVFDGVHITLQSTGISYDYQAYKNKMLIAYPESIIDDDLVYKNDVFDSRKESGKVIYSHEIQNPFSRKDNDLIGGYCVIKNKRGEFITMLGKDDIDKHRKVARTDMFWQKWYPEMVRKTIIKKACKKHFADVFENIINMDNHENDIENDLEVSLSTKQEIENIFTVDELKEYYTNNKGKHKDDKPGFDKMITKRKEEIKEIDNGTD